MNEDKDEQLFRKYPDLFRHRHDHAHSMMGAGFCCGDGWFDLIDKLLFSIQSYPYPKDSPVEVVQVKEKFGGLRFYIEGGDNQVHKLIALAEGESFRICEECGCRDDVITGGKFWAKTLCKTCRQASEE